MRWLKNRERQITVYDDDANINFNLEEDSLQLTVVVTVDKAVDVRNTQNECQQTLICSR
jgi:hypothetical protein